MAKPNKIKTLMVIVNATEGFCPTAFDDGDGVKGGDKGGDEKGDSEGAADGTADGASVSGQRAQGPLIEVSKQVHRGSQAT